MSIEAMKQALDVFKSATPKYTRQRKDQKTLGGALDYWRLEQYQRMKAIKALEEALTQEQDEPVAWVIWFCGYPAGFFEKRTDAIKAFEQRNLDYPEESRKLLPLYTTPQQRTWVDLTDEEVADIERNSITRRQAIRAIEAKLKDKNL